MEQRQIWAWRPRRLARAGYRVVVSGRSQQTVDRALTGISGQASGFPLDFTKLESVSEFFTRAGPFDHLALVGSGQAAWGPFRDLKLEALKVAFDQKFDGFFLCAQAGLAQLRKDGSITFVICLNGAINRRNPGGAGDSRAAGSTK